MDQYKKNIFSDASFVCPIMIGREQPLQALIQLFDQARKGHGQIVLVTGEAGIGKSRLIREFRTQLLSVQILQGNCYELDQMQPYAPFINMLHGFPIADNTAHMELLGELANLLPGLDADFTISINSDFDQQRLTQTLTRLFLQMSRSIPLVMIIEDLHWCDEASLEYLSYLAQHLGDYPILLFLSWRSDGLTPALVRCAASIERTRRATEFRLSPLNLMEMETMLNNISEQKYTVHIDFMEHLHHLTEGNPFFIEEMLRSLAVIEEREPIPDKWDKHLLERVQIPRTVQASVQQRTDLLSPNTKQVLILAAVIGRSFDFSLLQHLTGLPETELLICLRELITAQLVLEETPDQFSFRHALTRQAVYTGLLGRERKTLHRAIAEEIEQLYSEKQRDKLITDLAFHCYQGELWSKAMDYSIEAGDHARRLYSPTTAVEHYTNALLAARHNEVKVSSALYQVRGKMYEMLGDFEAARGDFEQLVEAAQQHQDVVAEAQGLLDLGFLWTARDYDRAGDYFQQAAAAARGSDDTSLLANTLNRIGLWYTHDELPFEGLRHHVEALNIYRDLDNSQGIGETLDLLGVTAFMAGDLRQGWDYFEQAIALCRLVDNRPQLATLLLTSSIRGGALLVDTLVWIEASQEACVQQCDEAIQIARDIRLPATEAYARILLAHVLGWQGVFARALYEAETSLSIAQDIDHRMWQINARVILGLLHLELLDDSTALYHLEQVSSEIERIQSVYMLFLVSSVLSRVYIARHQLPQAEQILNRVITPNLSMQTLAQRLVWTAQAELLLAEQRPETALNIVDKLIETTQNRTDAVTIPRLWYLKGKALVALKRGADAETILQVGYDSALNSGNRPLAWRIGIEISNLYVILGKREEAQDCFDAVRGIIQELADELPAGALREQFHRKATRLLPRSTLITPQKAVKRLFDGLTGREREVAALVALGKTNAAIADSLTLSERTIEKHIENIMNKLNFKARSQIAVWATEKKLNT